MEGGNIVVTGNIHATDFVGEENDPPQVPVMVLYGSERTLKVDALHRIPGCATPESEDDLCARKPLDAASQTSPADQLEPEPGTSLMPGTARAAACPGAWRVDATVVFTNH